MKRTASLVLAALMTCALLTGGACALEPTETLSLTETAETITAVSYPVSVTEYSEGEAHRIGKTYELTADDDPASIPTADFDREGYTYTLLDLTRQDQTTTDAKPHTEAVTVNSKSKAMDKILPLFPATKDVTTEDGYAGVLTLDTASLKTEAAGYGKSSKAVTATRSYPNLSDADASFVPKTIEDNGRTLGLADVQWQEAGGFYHATATYTGTATSSYVTGYTVTASYTGEVTRTASDKIVYTAIFGGTAIQPEKSEEIPAPIAPVSQVGSTGVNWLWLLLLLPIGGGAVGLVFLGKFLLKKYKAKKGWKEYTK